MRNLFSCLLVMLVTFGLMMSDADARRFGSGRSFGMSRSASSFSRPSSYAAPTQRAAGNKWVGPLAGLAAGGLLASLFMGHGGGMGGGILSWLMIGGVAMFLWSLLRRNMQPISRSGNSAVLPFESAPIESTAVRDPAGFDRDAFLRDVKVQFIRLQAAYDNKNLNDLREFTTPEVTAEIQLQFQERGDGLNQTEVVTVNTQLLDVAMGAQGLEASVLFSGLIREEANEAPALFNETWHFRKDNNQAKWLVAGIQQTSS